MRKGDKMAELTEAQVRELFRAMHTKGTSVNNVATTGRTNSADPFNGNDFLNKFDELLDDGLDITETVYERFGA